MHPDVPRAVEALTDASLAHVVDLVAYRDDESVVVVNHAGASRLTPGRPAELLHGRDPVADTDPLRFAEPGAEAADPSPPNARHAYPYPAERLASLFASGDRAPDVAIVHTAPHFFPERGGHVGEHGSLNVVQSRAPLLLAGAGVTRRGVLADHTRTVDVGPTLAAALAGRDAVPTDLDGRPRLDLVDAGAARWVVGLLWDGAPSSEVLGLAAAGELPHVARLLDRGLALQGGAVAEFPSLTLVNHTSALTGLGPGRHGVVGNVFHDRATGQQVRANDPTTWHRWAEWVRPGVTTAFDWVAAAQPGRVVASVNEPVDGGATHSTMALIRAMGASMGSGPGAGGLAALLPDPTGSPHATQVHVLADADYAWSTQVDDAGLEQVLQLWADPREAPALLWWNSIVTDTGHHAGGPRSDVARAALRDADRRLGVLLDRLDALGVSDDVTVLLTADHGFEGADPAVRGDWTPALAAAGLEGFRDEGPGLLYLGPARDRR